MQESNLLTVCRSVATAVGTRTSLICYSLHLNYRSTIKGKILPTIFSGKALDSIDSPSTLTVVIRLLDSSVLSLSLKKL